MGTFNHSVKVPKLYKCAAKICQEVARGGSSIKQLVYEKKHFNTKALYALIVTTFQKAQQIDLLLKRTKLFEKEPRLDPWLAKIFISELIWGKKKLPQSEAKPIQTILAYEQVFKAHLSDTSDGTVKGNDAHKKPRYVRINTLFNSFNEAVELFQNEGWIQQQIPQNNYQSFIEHVCCLEGDHFVKDIHVPDLLIFPNGTEFYNHPGYKRGSIILQDKASCLPVHILSPPPGSTVLDMCAAPGMKTTQLAALLNDEGTVYAVERDPKRYEILNKMVETSGSECIKTLNKDVLECSHSDFPGVEYILVDPSCSGSGMVGRLEISSSQSDSRLRKLAGFQIKILRSALTRYPQAKRIVYSTCSLYPEENEDVVRQVLESNNDFKLVPAENFVNRTWKNFGSREFGEIGRYCLYSRPEDDLTNGFFVAVFERLEEGEHNQFYNGRVLKYMKNQNRKEERIKKRVLKRMEEEALEENESANSSELKKKPKKSKKQDCPENEIHQLENNEETSEKNIHGESKAKESKKKQKRNSDEAYVNITDSEPTQTKKKKKQLIREDETNQINSSEVKKKKKTIKMDFEVGLTELSNDENVVNIKKEKKKRKIADLEDDASPRTKNDPNVQTESDNLSHRIGKKNKKNKHKI